MPNLDFMIHFPADETKGFKQDLNVTPDMDDSSTTAFDNAGTSTASSNATGGSKFQWQHPEIAAHDASPLPAATQQEVAGNKFFSTRRLRSMRRNRLVKTHQATIYHVDGTADCTDQTKPKSGLFNRKSKKNFQVSFPDDEISLHREKIQQEEVISHPEDELSNYFDEDPSDAKRSRFRLRRNKKNSKKNRNSSRGLHDDDESKFSLDYGGESFYHQVESTLFEISCNFLENFVELCCSSSARKRMEIEGFVDPMEAAAVVAEDEKYEEQEEEEGKRRDVSVSKDDALQRRAREIVARNKARNPMGQEEEMTIRPILLKEEEKSDKEGVAQRELKYYRKEDAL